MNLPVLAAGELDLLRRIFRRHPEVTSATLFGSRAKGTHTERPDVDLAVTGDVAPLRAEAIAAELEELPLPTGSRSSRWTTSTTVRCWITSSASASASIRNPEDPHNGVGTLMAPLPSSPRKSGGSGKRLARSLMIGQLDPEIIKP